jgi:hypothetical protein
MRCAMGLWRRSKWLLLLAVLASACGGDGSRGTGPTPPPTRLELAVRGVTVRQGIEECTGTLTATGPGPTQTASLPPFSASLALTAGTWTITVTLTCNGQTASASATVDVVPPNPVNVDIRLNARGTLTVNTVGGGSVAVSPTGEGCGAGCQRYLIGTDVTLRATPDTGFVFAGWRGGGCSGTGRCTVTIRTTPTVVTATFTAVPLPPPAVTLTVTITGSGSGIVTSVPAGIACPPTCTGTFPAGTTVTLTASPGGDSLFAGWTGGGCSGTGTCTVVTAPGLVVTAHFEVPGAITVGNASTTTTLGSITISGGPLGMTFTTGPLAPGATQTFFGVLPGTYTAAAGSHYGGTTTVCPARTFTVAPGGVTGLTYNQAGLSPIFTCVVS